MLVSPLLLLRSSHTHPHQVWVGIVYKVHHRLALLLRELILIGRAVCHHLKVRKILTRAFLNDIKHLLTRTKEQHPLALVVNRCLQRLQCIQFPHLVHKQVPSCHPLLGCIRVLQPLTSLHHTHTVRYQHIAIHQSLGKCLILLRIIIRKSIYRVNQQFALRQSVQLRLAVQQPLTLQPHYIIPILWHKSSAKVLKREKNTK